MEIWVQRNLPSLPHNFPLFLTTSLNFLLRVTVGQSFRPVEPRFPYRAETWEQKPIELGNILTILNLRGGNMGIGEHSLSSSQLFSILSSGWLWVEVSDLLCFYTFSTLLLLALLFSLVKAPLDFCSLYICEFWTLFSIINTSKEPKERFGPFSHFRPLSQKRPGQFFSVLCGYV